MLTATLGCRGEGEIMAESHEVLAGSNLRSWIRIKQPLSPSCFKDTSKPTLHAVPRYPRPGEPRLDRDPWDLFGPG